MDLNGLFSMIIFIGAIIWILYEILAGIEEDKRRQIKPGYRVLIESCTKDSSGDRDCRIYESVVVERSGKYVKLSSGRWISLDEPGLNIVVLGPAKDNKNK